MSYICLHAFEYWSMMMMMLLLILLYASVFVWFDLFVMSIRMLPVSAIAIAEK